MKRKILFPFLTLVLFSMISFSCKDSDDGSVKICDAVVVDGTYDDGGVFDVFFLVQINDQDLPYYSVYQDENNYSSIVSGLITIRDKADGSKEWESTLTNKQVINGASSSNPIDRSGTFTCSGNTLALVNDQNMASGTVSQSGEYIILDGGSVQYKFSR